MPQPLAMMIQFSNENVTSLGNSVDSDCSVITVDRQTKSKGKQQQHAPVPACESKKVHFKTNVKVRRISSHRKYSAEEREAVWYSPAEAKQTRDSAVSTVKKMMKGVKVDEDENDCSRGLEFKKPKKSKIRSARKRDIILTVLVEQEMSRDKDDGSPIDAQHLSDVYRFCTHKIAIEAMERGMKDQIEAWGA